MTRLLEIASHDLRSPLAAIKAHTDNLLDGVHGSLRIEAKRRIRQIQRIARDGAESVEEILSFTAAAGEMTCRDLGKVIREASSSARLRGRGRGLMLLIRVPSRLPALPVPRVLLKAAVRNLVENAFQASPSAGRVVVEARRDEGFVRIEVKDRGRASRLEGRSGVGVREGIGLRIVRQLAEERGGEVFAGPRPGGGMRVGFSIPCGTSPTRVGRSGRG